MSGTPQRVASPCIRQCCLNEHDICLGCYRSLREIVAWGEADDRRRRAIVAAANHRRGAAAAAPAPAAPRPSEETGHGRR